MHRNPKGAHSESFRDHKESRRSFTGVICKTVVSVNESVSQSTVRLERVGVPCGLENTHCGILLEYSVVGGRPKHLDVEH